MGAPFPVPSPRFYTSCPFLLGEQEAVLSAELATGHPVQLSLLEEATEQLIRSADEHIHQVRQEGAEGACGRKGLT
jgi:hypothetical protein